MMCDTFWTGTTGRRAPLNPATLSLFLRHPTMYDDLWIEIQDAPGEIFDIDIDEEEVEQSFESKLNSKYDFW